MRKKSKNKSKVRVRKDKKGRYLKFEGKKHYLKMSEKYCLQRHDKHCIPQTKIIM